MTNCHKNNQNNTQFDYLLFITSLLVILSYIFAFYEPVWLKSFPVIQLFNQHVFTLVNTMWWGVLIGILMIGLLSTIPQKWILMALGSHKPYQGIFRAAIYGVLFDLCSHGILMVGAKLYERGANISQVVTFLIASPWNSISLTIILISLIGITWTVVIIVLSMLIAIITGFIFQILENLGKIPHNPNKPDSVVPLEVKKEATIKLKQFDFSYKMIIQILIRGILGARMILRWLLLGILIAALLRIFFTPEQYELVFGPTLIGLGLTTILATFLEVCSEGSAPIAADIFKHAKAPGNGFAFLMGGVATDYTEFLVLREVTKTFRIPILMILISLPQVLILGFILNNLA